MNRKSKPPDAIQYKPGQCAPGVWKPDRVISAGEQKALDQLRDHINAGLRLIIGTQRSWSIGDIMPATAASYSQGGRLYTLQVTHPFMVRAVCTFEDWLANTPPWIPGPKPQKWQAIGFKFYEVSTD